MKYLRPGIYLFSLAVLLFFIFLKKESIVEHRKKPVVSLVSEIESFGYPVDVTQVDFDSLSQYVQVTLNPNKTARGPSSKSAHFWISPHRLNTVQPGMALLDDDGKNLKIGQVVRVASSLDSSRGMYRVEVTLDAEDYFNQGHFRTAKLVYKKIGRALVVPARALRSLRSEDFVWVVDKNHSPKKQPVKVGRKNSVTVEILSGLKKGELVVVNGFAEIGKHQRLRIRHCLGCNEVIHD